MLFEVRVHRMTIMTHGRTRQKEPRTFIHMDMIVFRSGYPPSCIDLPETKRPRKEKKKPRDWHVLYTVYPCEAEHRTP